MDRAMRSAMRFAILALGTSAGAQNVTVSAECLYTGWTVQASATGSATDIKYVTGTLPAPGKYVSAAAGAGSLSASCNVAAQVPAGEQATPAASVSVQTFATSPGPSSAFAGAQFTGYTRFTYSAPLQFAARMRIKIHASYALLNGESSGTVSWPNGQFSSLYMSSGSWEQSFDVQIGPTPLAFDVSLRAVARSYGGTSSVPVGATLTLLPRTSVRPGAVPCGHVLRGDYGNTASTDTFRLSIAGAVANAPGVLVLGAGLATVPLPPPSACPLLVSPALLLPFTLDAAGAWQQDLTVPSVPGLLAYAQTVSVGAGSVLESSQTLTFKAEY